MPADNDELSAHRIERITARRLRTRWNRLLGRNAFGSEHGYGSAFTICQIATDRGAVGWGMARRTPVDATADLIGRRVSDVFDPDVGATDAQALTVDLPLHDLAGVILGEPVHRLVGPVGVTDIPCYGAMTYMDDITPAYAPGGVEVVVRHAESDYALGYRAFKIKIGRGFKWMETAAGLRRDIEVTRAMRERFPDVTLIVDGNDGFDCDGFLRYFQAVADCRLYSIEEPFKENRDDLRRLREAIEKLSPSTTVTEGEGRPDLELLLELGREGLVDILNMDIEGYGFTRWRAAAPRALAAGMLLAPHTFGLRLKTFYAAQLVAGLGGACPLEGVIDETEGVDTSGYAFAEGILSVPDAPGFGLPLIWAPECGAFGDNT